MNLEELKDYFNTITFDNKKIESIKNSINKKKLVKREPYDILLTICCYLYCIEDKIRFNEICNKFITPNIDYYMSLNFEIWSYIEQILLLSMGVNDDNIGRSYIEQKGFVASRLDGTMLNLNLKNLQIEKQENILPKETILNRYRSIIDECILMIRMGKKSMFRSNKKTIEMLKKSRAGFLCVLDNFYSDDQYLSEQLGKFC